MTQEQIAHKEGQSYIGKTAQSKFLTEIGSNGRTVLQEPQKITGYEVVESFQEPEVMVFIGGESIYASTLINIK